MQLALTEKSRAVMVGLTLMVTILCPTYGAWAQDGEQPAGEGDQPRKVMFQFEGASIESVLASLSRATGLTFLAEAPCRLRGSDSDSEQDDEEDASDLGWPYN